jgi:lipoate-protein ligase A
MKTIFLSQLNPQNQMLFEQNLFSRANESGEIILLLYSWNGKVISTGKLQKKLNINHGKCEKDGVKIIERITGGRAVFHENDICYSICVPKILMKNVGKNLQEAIVKISEPIIKTFTDFGISAVCKNHKISVLHSDFCAQTHSYGEITVGGKKIAASSQIFSSDGILQHGTIPITDDNLKICDYFNVEKHNLRENSTCLTEVCENFNPAFFLRKLSDNFIKTHFL